MTLQEAIEFSTLVESALIDAVATPDSDFKEIMLDTFGEVDEVEANIDTLTDIAAQFVGGALNQKDFRLLVQRVLATNLPKEASFRKAEFNPYRTKDTYYVHANRLENKTIKEYEADGGGNTGYNGEFFASGIVVTLPSEVAEKFAGVFYFDENPQSGHSMISLKRASGDKVAALKAERGMYDALNGGQYEREFRPAFFRMLKDVPMVPTRYASASVSRIVARFRAKTAAVLPQGQKQKVNMALMRKGMDGNKPWPRLGQALSEIGAILAANGISHDTMSSNYFRGKDGTARLDIDFINEADPFSPTPITNSMLVVTYHQFEETDRWEVVAYLS